MNRGSVERVKSGATSTENRTWVTRMVAQWLIHYTADATEKLPYKYSCQGWITTELWTIGMQNFNNTLQTRKRLFFNLHDSALKTSLFASQIQFLWRKTKQVIKNKQNICVEKPSFERKWILLFFTLKYDLNFTIFLEHFPMSHKLI